MKNLRWLLLFLVIVGVIILINQNNSNRGVVTVDDVFKEKSCKFPCWYGLVLGETSLTEARLKIATFPYAAHSKSGIAEGRDDNFYYVGWSNYVTGDGATFAFEKELLRRMRFKLDGGISLQDVLNLYGDPSAWTMDHSFGGPESVYSHLTITLYYVNRGLIANFFIYQGQLTNRFMFMPEANLEEFWLVPVSNSFIQMLIDQLGYSRNLSFKIVSRDFKTIWPGTEAQVIDSGPQIKMLLEAFGYPNQ